MAHPESRSGPAASVRAKVIVAVVIASMLAFVQVCAFRVDPCDAAAHHETPAAHHHHHHASSDCGGSCCSTWGPGVTRSRLAAPALPSLGAAGAVAIAVPAEAAPLSVRAPLARAGPAAAALPILRL